MIRKSIVNSLTFHCKRHNQNKAGSTVNKTQYLLNVFVQCRICE